MDHPTSSTALAPRRKPASHSTSEMDLSLGQGTRHSGKHQGHGRVHVRPSATKATVNQPDVSRSHVSSTASKHSAQLVGMGEIGDNEIEEDANPPRKKPRLAPANGSLLSARPLLSSSVAPPRGSNNASSHSSDPLPSSRGATNMPSSYQGNGTNTLGRLGTKVDGLDNTLKRFQERVDIFQKTISTMEADLKTMRSSLHEERNARIVLEQRLSTLTAQIHSENVTKEKLDVPGREEDIKPTILKGIEKGKPKERDPRRGDFLAITSAAFFKMMGCGGTKDLPDPLPNGDYWIDQDGDEYLRPNWKKDWKGANDEWELPLINYIRTNGPALAKRPGFDISPSCFSNKDIGTRLKGLFVASKAKYALSDAKQDAIAQAGRRNVRKTRKALERREVRSSTKLQDSRYNFMFDDDYQSTDLSDSNGNASAPWVSYPRSYMTDEAQCLFEELDVAVIEWRDKTKKESGRKNPTMHHARRRDFDLLNQCNIPIIPIERSRNRIAARFVDQDYLAAHPDHRARISDNDEEDAGCDDESEEHNTDHGPDDSTEPAGLDNDNDGGGTSAVSDDDQDHSRDSDDEQCRFIDPSLRNEMPDDDGDIPRLYRPSGPYT